ncbi:MAG: glycylpeptide N-tetradecanoyltransferase [Cirrosporium novae-zelandiae]|nr:MAG: glycylpeptide N-tetradecanoyltransferase [Cirrosporium novae-zelandiae]
MSEEANPPDPTIEKEAEQDLSDSENEPTTDTNNPDEAASGSASKKKKSKKNKLKEKVGIGGSSNEKTGKEMSNAQVDQLLAMNPALKGEMAGLDKDKAKEMLKKMNINDLLTGMTLNKKNHKDMASYKFWQTQPVPKFDDKGNMQEGPIQEVDPEKVPKEPLHIDEAFEWVTMDLKDEKEIEEVYELLAQHYVEDDDAMFRFNYSISFLNWALKSPGWRKDWHVGVRASKSHKLVAFISGVPVSLRVRSKVLNASEINFLCIHKKLRSKRLAPLLIKEITRRCHVFGIYQAVYTAGIILPKPVSSCRYYHRALDWLKLHEVGFSPLPAGSTKSRQITWYRLPQQTATPGLRPMEPKDLSAIKDLLERYLARFSMAPKFTAEELDHWLLPKTPASGVDGEQVVWTYVVEDSSTQKLTDFVSFYCLESSVIGNPKHNNVRAAYLFYYASETAFDESDKKDKHLKQRLNMLMKDALILAKELKFDVFNALTLLDNPLFLEEQRFGAGDGQLHYYLYNYFANTISGGVNERNKPDENKRGGVGLVML